MMASANCWLIVFAGLFIGQAYGNVNINGHQTPLVVGHRRNITCTWSERTAATMEWYLVGVDTSPIESKNNTNAITLSIDSTSGLDGARFKCKVTTYGGEQFEEIATLTVKELTNRVEIQASSEVPTAGEPFTLTCIITSDMQPQVMWRKPNGESTGGETQDENGLINTLQFNPLNTSHGGTYTCVSYIASPHSRQDAKYSLTVQIPAPTISITRQPIYPTPLIRGDELKLKCIVQIIPEVDTPFTVHSGWSGHSSLSDVQRVNISDLHGVYPTYLLMTTFSTVIFQDTGLYTCWAYISPDDNNGNVQQSPQVSDAIDIHISFRVDIEITYDPPLDLSLPTPPYYRPGTSVTLTCRASDAVGAVTYQWSSTCPSCFSSRSSAQSVTQNILTPSDAGQHTCTVTDLEGNTRSNSTEMKLIGAGIFVSRGNPNPSTVVSNNSIVLSNLYCCSNRVQLYCYSNSTTQTSSEKYLIWPDGTRYQPNYCHYCEVCISSRSAGIFIESYSRYHPGTGIYTCQLKDSNENWIDISFGMYSSMPQPPNITTMEYTNMIHTTNYAVANITCLSENSPPTNVTWMMDGSVVDIDEHNYSILQTVTNRQTSQYRTTLMIKTLFTIIGTHNFTCLITNAAGNDAESIITYFPAIPVVNISSDVLLVHSKATTIKCVSYIQDMAFSHEMLPHLHLEWVGPNGVIIISDSTVIVEDQRIENNTVVRNLTFDALRYSHSGQYKCRATLNTGNELSMAETNYTLVISSQALFQLKFGPFEHCTQWYHDEGIFSHLEGNVKSSVIEFINKKSTHNFPLSVIDKGEFSCQTASSSVTYRARITGSENSLTAPVLINLIREWVLQNGTFTYTYEGKEEIKIDPHCPLEIESFSVPECGTGNITISGHETPTLIGETRSMNCTWHGRKADKMEWYLVGLDTIPIESAQNTNNLVLSSYLNTTALDGAMFACRVTVGMHQYEEIITMFVERLENDISIETSADPPRAGEDFTITCSVFSNKPTQLAWLGANELRVSGENLLLSPQVTKGMITSLNLTINKLQTSQAGVYTCVSVMGSSKKKKSILVEIEIPPPNVTIKYDHSQHTELYATNPLTMKCTVEVNPAVDTMVTVNAQWKGPSTLFDNGQRVIISELEGLHPYYESAINFTSLNSEDAGKYLCLATVSSLDDSSLLIPTISRAEMTLNIVLNVTIQVIQNRPTDFTPLSPPYYHPASSITLICNARGATEITGYHWTSTCAVCSSWTYTTQSVNINVLTSAYAGIYTCTVTDGNGRNSSSSIEIKVKGSGMYIQVPYIRSSVNNSIVIVSSSYSCYERLKVFCYSDAQSQDVGSVTAYNGQRYFSGSYNYLSVSRQNPAGLLLQYTACRGRRLPSGVYTCEIPDASGVMTELSIAVYASTPGAPVIETITFNNLLTHNMQQDPNPALVEIICNTKISPPTNVTWLRDGKKLNMDGTLYQTVSSVADRINYLYNTTLIIRDAANIGGIHEYTCIVSNAQGEDQMMISTNITDLFDMNILLSTEPIHEHNFTLQCVATPSPKVRQILPYLTLEWIKPDVNITPERQMYSTHNTTQALHFSPLTVSHSGLYACRVRLNIPNSYGNYVTSRNFDLAVFNYTYIQLKFGPVIHCSILHKNEEMATQMKYDVSHFLAKYVDEMCTCGYEITMIDEEKISCHTQTAMVVYRARIAGSSHTVATSHLIALIQQWLFNDCTFLYTYYGRIRLRADSHCPLEIASFSEPECGI